MELCLCLCMGVALQDWSHNISELLKAKTTSPSSRFTADVRSVLSRNLHQHRLWWSAELRGRGCWAMSSLIPLLHRLPSCPPVPFSDEPPAVSEPLLWENKGFGGWAPHMGWTVWDRHSPETTEEGGGAMYFIFFFIFIFFFLSPTPKQQWSLFALSAPDTDCVRMTVSLCMWVGVPCWFH